MDKQKERYVSPRIEVIRIENEGSVMAASGNLPSPGDGGSGYSSASTYRSGSSRNYSGASSSDLEDLINDILTIEQ